MMSMSMEARTAEVNPPGSPGSSDYEVSAAGTIALEAVEGDDRAVEWAMVFLRRLWGRHFQRRIRLFAAGLVAALASEAPPPEATEAPEGEGDDER